MQRVSRDPSGIATVSMNSPSSSRKRNFSVPSLDVCRVARLSRGIVKCSSSRPRNAAGRSVIAAKLAAGFCHKCRSTCGPRNGFSPCSTAKSRSTCSASEGSMFRRFRFAGSTSRRVFVCAMLPSTKSMQLLNLTPVDAFLDPYDAALTSTPPSSRFATAKRSHLAGELRASHAGTKVKLGGLVHRIRNLGGIVFLDLRDRAGLIQVSFDPKWTPQEVIERAGKLGLETVVLIDGDVAARPTEMRNAEMETGEVEVRARDFKIVGPAETPAIPVARGKGEKLPAEELRLKHRNLDLRRPDLQKNIILRHRLQQATRRYLDERGFLEIETPILTKPTPEGARDYIVPSRVHPGEFYALPQSPQLYKQLLMISGFDRYFQIARCFRDEDLRADRQPEFTQIDIEASFITPEDIFSLTEGMLATLFKEIGQDIPV